MAHPLQEHLNLLLPPLDPPPQPHKPPQRPNLAPPIHPHTPTLPRQNPLRHRSTSHSRRWVWRVDSSDSMLGYGISEGVGCGFL
jgi:hypothetical protein